MSKYLLTAVASGLMAAACFGSAHAEAQRSAQSDRLGNQRESRRIEERSSGNRQLDAPRLNDRADREQRDYRDSTTTSDQQGVTVQQALIKKLQKTNDAEIELAKMAQQKAENQQLKQLTQTIIEDHQSFNEQLQQLGQKDRQVTGRDLDSRQQARLDGPPAAPGADSASADRTRNSAQLSQIGQRSDRLAEQADELRTQADQLRAQRDQLRAQGADSAEQAGARHSAARPVQQQAQTVPTQLCQIMEQACDNALQMNKKMLQQYEGQDFQMAYLGQQIVAHTTLLAELRAIESQGPQQLQPLAKQAAEKVEQHARQAIELAKRLEDEERAGSQSG